MEEGMKTGNVQAVNAGALLTLRWGRGGTVIVADAVGVEVKERRGGGVAGTQSGFLSWHTLHCPFPACWKMLKSTAPPPLAKTLLSQARQGAAETKHFALSPFPARFPPGVFVWIHSDL